MLVRSVFISCFPHITKVSASAEHRKKYVCARKDYGSLECVEGARRGELCVHEIEKLY
jgi:hypothetical protein